MSENGNSGFQFTPAKRSAVSLKLGIQGPSGSGKTFGALALASSIMPKGKIALIDTENHSASYYADRFEFQALDLAPPYTSARYIEAVKVAVSAGFDFLIIDSISHQWVGAGGILARKEAADARGGNSFANWAHFTKEHELFKARLLEAPIHIISTLRSKQEYALVENERGKQTPKKMGLAAIQREGFEYEFGIVFDVQMDHKAMISKDRTGLFASDEQYDLADAEVGKMLAGWMIADAEPEKEAPRRAQIADALLKNTDVPAVVHGSETKVPAAVADSSDDLPF